MKDILGYIEKICPSHCPDFENSTFPKLNRILNDMSKAYQGHSMYEMS
jgi:hypothetical protein